MKHMENYKNRNELMKDNESFEKKMDKIHTEELGLGMPEDYFVKSKIDILDKVFHERKSKVIPLFRNKVMWFAAAGIALIVALSVFKPASMSTINEIPSIITDTVGQLRNLDLNNGEFFVEDDILVASLFVDDSEIDDYLDNYIIEEIVIDEYIDHFLLDDLTGETMIFY
jgi:hypothetical protein